MTPVDILIIGGGIVGVSTALQARQRYPRAKVVLVEKEAHLAGHQTGHNSGVVHAGVYYKPGSLKADFCRRGARMTRDFCFEHGLPFEQCGKLLVATDALEYQRMGALEKRCALNGIATERLGTPELRRMEPHISGVGALLVRATAITDYPRITQAMAQRFVDLGGSVRLGQAVVAMAESTDGISVTTTGGRIFARYLVACGGLMADRLARMLRIDTDFRIIPFRGEYYRLAGRHRSIIRHLIYPIPDPALPFLGVHLTRMIDGSVTVGPNAVIGWKREGYGRINVSPADVLDMMRFPGFWKVMARHFRTGLAEMRDSLLVSGYLERVRTYCPVLNRGDLTPYPTGIRAQAVLKDGSLVHDFLFARSRRSLHVCNAPSPAATSALPIGNYICQKMAEAFRL